MALATAAVAAACYVNTLGNDFAFDDHRIIVKNPVVTEPGRASEVWTRPYWSALPGPDPDRDLLYRPLVIASYRVNRILGGAGPFSFHLINTVLHALVSAGVVLIGVRMTAPPAAALAAGLLFAAMPIHTEAVANIVGRAELLAALFTVGAALGAFRAIDAVGGRRFGWWSLTCLCALAALLSKEVGAAAIPIVLLVRHLAARQTGRRASPDPSPGGHRIRARDTVVEYAGVAAVAVIYLALRSYALDGQLWRTGVTTRVANALADAGGAQRFWTVWLLLGTYVTKTFWPVVLCADYSYKSIEIASGLFRGGVLLGLMFFAGLIVAGVLAWRRGNRWVAVCGAALLLSYLPAANAFYLLKTLFAERLWYLPSLWLSLLLGMAAAPFLAPAQLRGRSFGRYGVRALLGVMVMAGAMRCWVRNRDWHDNGSLFASAYAVHPQSTVVLYGLGVWLLDHGETRHGMELLQHCLDIWPGFTLAHRALGRRYLEQRSYRTALDHLQTAETLTPGDPDTQRRLAVARAALDAGSGDRLEALRRTATERPDDLEALAALVTALHLNARNEEALALLDAATERFRDEAGFHHLRAVTLGMLARRGDAIAAYRECIELDGKRTDALVELAFILLDRRANGDQAEARHLVDQAWKIDPDRQKVMIARAEMLVLEGRNTEAAALYRTLFERLPADHPSRRQLQHRWETLRRN